MQPKILRLVVHPIQKPVAGRAKNPDLFRPDKIFFGAACAESLVPGPVRDLSHPILAAGFACTRRGWIQPIKTEVCRISWSALACSLSIDRLHQRAPLVEFANRFRVARAPTDGRTKPFVALIRPKRNVRAADPARMASRRRAATIRFSPARLASLRAPLPPEEHAGNRLVTPDAAERGLFHAL